MKILKKPELLLPAGNIESFYAAIEGGANAIYLGMKYFNARNRASNFTNSQLNALIKIATEQNIRVYITLNTVIKNNEIHDLIEALWTLLKLKVTAVIIQDWGVYYILRKFFPNLVIHASTQMANHNSLGLEYSALMGFERVILARELTLNEIKSIQAKSSIEIEIFTHGALCYSFSGMCLFSSFLGGHGANRGYCTQPCRRNFKIEENEQTIFSLKDYQLIDYIALLSEIGISSVKIEGRMKSAEYVYRVAKAYRMVIDNPENLNEAKELLNLDFGREKTDYFMGHQLDKAITNQSSTGILLGKIEKINKQNIEFESKIELSQGCRLRIRTTNDLEQIAFIVNDIKKIGFNKYSVQTDASKLSVENEVYLASLRDKKFNSKLSNVENKEFKVNISKTLKDSILEERTACKPESDKQVFIRINDLDWLQIIDLEKISGLFINLTKRELSEIELDNNLLTSNKYKIFFELPKFISEKNIEFYQGFVDKCIKSGNKNFVISHLSQIVLLPEEALIYSNENVYCYNDYSIKLLKHQGIENFIYPLENDLENLKSYADTTGILPIYFHPELFYSRMPVQLASNETSFKDEKNIMYHKSVKNGITIISPENPVAFTQYIVKYKEMGYSNFLVDLSHSLPSKNKLQNVLKKVNRSEQIQPSYNFNMKNGLK